MKLVEQIKGLKKSLNAVILAHYYQEPEIQDIADFIGDSLELSRKAKESTADVIMFCGVRFMAEVAKILNPDKTVLIPDIMAGCSLEDSCKPDDFAKFRAIHKNAVAITYINCSAEVKALSDIICTSSNAEKIINSIPKDKDIIFAPDKNLGAFLQKKTGRSMILWNGSCFVHDIFSEKALVSLITRHPSAFVIAHPECTDAVLKYSQFTASTSKLLAFVGQSKDIFEFIVLTESGILHQMKALRPDATFYTVQSISKETEDCVNCSTCSFMKMNTLEKVFLSLKNGFPRIEMDQKLINEAKKPLEKMLSLSL